MTREPSRLDLAARSMPCQSEGINAMKVHRTVASPEAAPATSSRSPLRSQTLRKTRAQTAGSPDSPEQAFQRFCIAGTWERCNVIWPRPGSSTSPTTSRKQNLKTAENKNGILSARPTSPPTGKTFFYLGRSEHWGDGDWRIDRAGRENAEKH